MELICLDLEGVLVPEIWIAVAEKTGLEELRLTTRDISDYDELMNYRLGILDREGILLKDIQNVIETLEPLDGAYDFTKTLREESQLVILSDTFSQFAAPLMRKLEMPTLFCNTLLVEGNGRISGIRLRQNDGKRKAVEAFRSMGLRVFAAGDSYNDVTMLKAAHQGMFFRPPQSIRDEFPAFPGAETHDELLSGIRSFLIA
ncbi:MAG: bifunctional phosphoserine phosphatase/homoserine phosphotransferase ThrH [Spirochaetaceae bacterium]|nr:bifunctional phosphoserine phosphatase/homoserine phosphotransferase ThrH [Spirochaetaceae bacterium]RKX81359.1 MAG: bifunctional phosphoserine phosphatase/homoserine phosphotransferase ThrH [Spirochaetota bacterium]RKX90122.1 MAG: bifunctional phosphoserine phosphatase/homoserine phosphotransferase ThrH [Spirochaetota bacterium]